MRSSREQRTGLRRSRNGVVGPGKCRASLGRRVNHNWVVKRSLPRNPACRPKPPDSPDRQPLSSNLDARKRRLLWHQLFPIEDAWRRSPGVLPFYVDRAWSGGHPPFRLASGCDAMFRPILFAVVLGQPQAVGRSLYTWHQLLVKVMVVSAVTDVPRREAKICLSQVLEGTTAVNCSTNAEGFAHGRGIGICN